MGAEQSATAEAGARSVQQMDADMRHKLGKGEKYNMKVLICGSTKSGKTSLFLKLQGKAMEETYTATHALQCGHVHWNPKRCEDVVKVEVWDVPVAPSSSKGHSVSLDAAIKASKGKNKLQGSFVIEELVSQQDPTALFRGCSAALVTINPHSPASLEYAAKQLTIIPPTAFVCVLALFQDVQDKWRVSREQMQDLVASRDRTFYSECSNVSNFGLQVLYSFLELPFLQLQRETLLKRIEINEQESRLAIADFGNLVKGNLNPSKTAHGAPHVSSSESSSESASEEEPDKPPPPRSTSVKTGSSKPPPPPSTTTTKSSSANNNSSSNNKSSTGGTLKTEPSKAKNDPRAEDILNQFNPGDIDEDFLDSGDEKPAPKQASIRAKSSASDMPSDSTPKRKAQVMAIPDDSGSDVTSDEEAKQKPSSAPPPAPKPKALPKAPATTVAAAALSRDQDDELPIAGYAEQVGTEFGAESKQEDEDEEEEERARESGRPVVYNYNNNNNNNNNGVSNEEDDDEEENVSTPIPDFHMEHLPDLAEFFSGLGKPAQSEEKEEKKRSSKSKSSSSRDKDKDKDREERGGSKSEKKKSSKSKSSSSRDKEEREGKERKSKDSSKDSKSEKKSSSSSSKAARGSPPPSERSSRSSKQKVEEMDELDKFYMN